jgi:diguanylate cyclase (GGDEF)-like protein
LNAGFFIHNFLVAAAFFIAAQAGLLLAVPPSNAAAVWPAAGVAVAAVIILGPRILVGILIVGVFIKGKIIVDALGVDDIFFSLLMAFVASTGAVMQAWIGASLVRPILAEDPGLFRDRSIMLFCLLAGPVTCIISASVGVWTLWVQGILSLADLPLAWGIWWIGDSVGVLVFCPILLCFFGVPRHTWKQRIQSVVIPLCILIVIVSITLKFSHQQELKYIEGEFEKNAHHFKNELIVNIDAHLGASKDLRVYFNSSEEVSADEFSRYATPKLSRYPQIHALEWIPKIRHQDRQIFEDRMGDQIKVRGQNDKMDVAPVQDFYYPVEFLEPLTGNENALGFDISSNPTNLKAANKACRSGKVEVTDAISLVQEAIPQIAVIFFNPVYQKKGEGELSLNCEQLLGFTASIFKLENVIKNIHKKLSDLHMLISLSSKTELLYSDDLAAASGNPGFQRSYEISVANQQWQLAIEPDADFVSTYSSWSLWIITVSGLLFSAVFGLGLLMLTGRYFLTEEKIDQRTAELNDEIKRRKDIALLLVVENKCLDMITQSVSTHDVLDAITAGIDKIIPDARSSILLLDVDGIHLRHGSAPKLPKGYVDAVDGVAIGLSVGSCGTAAYLNKQTIVTDIVNDPLWADYTELASTYNLKACWSTPITVSHGKVLGTFALYFNTPKEPSLGIIDLIQRMANIAAIAILRKQSEEQLTFHANHDALTALANRREFERRATGLLESVKRDKQQHALCFMDLDQFKVVNDSCGHAAGDEMLKQISSALLTVIRKRDTLARMGGDEFSVLMEHCSLEQAQRLVDDLYKVIQEYVFIWEGLSFRVGVSIGLVAITELTPNLAELLKEADAACYMAKDSGRNQIYVYHPEDSETAQRHGDMQWVLKLNQALEENRFCLYAQTIIPLDNSNDRHYELLIRMIDENQKIILPGAFLPAAERYHIMTQLDLWVIGRVFTLLANNPVFVQGVSFISINLSGQSIADPSVLKLIKRQLEVTGIEANKICFEITETAAISNIAMATQLISTLKQLGCRFALDDFGSGLSSFGYLKNLPVDYLKIDGMFVKDIVDDAIDHAMVKSINEIGQIMGMKTIAEFVECDEIKELLRDIGVNYAQGFGISKPIPFEELLQTYQTNENYKLN